MQCLYLGKTSTVAVGHDDETATLVTSYCMQTVPSIAATQFAMPVRCRKESLERIASV